MHIPCRPFSFTIRLISLIVLLVNVTAGGVPRSPARIKPQLMRFTAASNARAAESSNSENHGSYVWNIDDGQLSLLALPEHLAAGVERSLSYPLNQFRLSIFQALNYDGALLETSTNGNTISPKKVRRSGLARVCLARISLAAFVKAAVNK